MARKPAQQFDLGQIQEQLTEGLRAHINRPNLYAYKPHDKQYKFHTSPKHTRLYIGGNRSGKTVGGGVETCYWLTKRHPYRKLPLPEGPVRGRAVAVDFNYGVDMIILPEIARWMPPSFLINGSWEDSYDREHRVLTLANKSFLEFRSYDQDLEKFAGTSRHFTWYDEEPPKHIFNESQARLVDTNGYAWLTMTPVEGMSWVYEDLYLPGTEGNHPDIDVIEIEMTENPHIEKESAERYLSTLSDEERKARERGEFVAMGGKVFKMFNKGEHVLPGTFMPVQGDGWEVHMSLDHGYNNPTAVLWHAVSPKNEIITFAEHYKSEMTVDQHAKAIRAFHATGLKREPDFLVGDPAINQRQGVTGTSIKQEYADRGIFLADGNNDVLSGVNRMIQYLRLDPTLGHPRWRITENCTNLIAEMSKLRWQTFSSRKMQYENNKQEKIKKKDDHACDSARYFFSMMPDLTPETTPAEDIESVVAKHTAILGAGAPAPVAGSWDELAGKGKSHKQESIWSESVDMDYYA